jgi:thioredoxin reductase
VDTVMLIPITIVGGGIAALVCLIARARARAEDKAVIAERLARFAGPNRDVCRGEA